MLGGARNLPALASQLRRLPDIPRFPSGHRSRHHVPEVRRDRVLAFILGSTLVTETKGRSLEEIEADLQEKATLAGVSLQLLT